MHNISNAVSNAYIPQASKAYIDLTGHRFGKWLVLKRADSKKATKWSCLCDCGAAKDIDSTSLRRGLSTSCGCISKTHGGFGTRPYRIWANMLNRCRNPNVPAYKHYGQRGITVCEPWLDFVQFREWAIANGYADNLTIERIDVDGNYEAGNCCWIPTALQSVNRRSARRDASGRPWCEIAEENGISKALFHSRSSHGWSDEKASTLPKGSRLGS